MSEELKKKIESCPVCKDVVDFIEYATCTLLFPSDEEKCRRCMEVMRSRREGRLTTEEALKRISDLGATREQFYDALQQASDIVREVGKKSE